MKFINDIFHLMIRFDEAMIHTNDGDEYLIYSPLNDETEHLWFEESVIGLDKDGTEHEIEYKDIATWRVL